jgi:hypothetical protein
LEFCIKDSWSSIERQEKLVIEIENSTDAVRKIVFIQSTIIYMGAGIAQAV